MTDDDRQLLAEFLLLRVKEGVVLKHGALKAASEQFKVSTQTVTIVWRRVRSCLLNGLPVDVKSRRKGAVGRKKVPLDLSLVEAVPLNQRRTLRSLSCVIGVSIATLHRRLKTGELRVHSNSLKPYLNHENMRERVTFCESHIRWDPVLKSYLFDDMMSIIHVDEKWFYLAQKEARFYLTSNEQDPHRHCKNKNFINKVMFFAAVARPRFSAQGNKTFDGKVGIWPLVYRAPAVRSSKNREKGVMVTKCIERIDRGTIREIMISKLLPAIDKKWPSDQRSQTIFIQQDNARTHILRGDLEFQSAVQLTGMDIQIRNQPPNSPDLNVLDLGYFNSIQSLQHEKSPSNLDSLIAVVEESFRELEPHKLNDIFITLQGCMAQCIGVNGSNNYKIPHVGKRKLERETRINSK